MLYSVAFKSKTLHHQRLRPIAQGFIQDIETCLSESATFNEKGFPDQENCSSVHVSGMPESSATIV